jgi:FkbM family methyltransferase
MVEKIMSHIDAYHINYVDTVIDNSRYLVPQYAHHRPAGHAVLNGHIYESQTHTLMESILKSTGKSAIHAGAFFGDMLPKFSEYCQSNLYVFEPVLENYIMSRRCAQINDLTNIIMFNAALSDETGHAYIKTLSDDGSHMAGMSHLSSQSKQTQLVNTIRIDDLTLQELCVVHLDVEGHETVAIDGAYETIKREEPVILTEDSKSKDMNIIKDLGYEMLFESNLIDLWTTDKYKQTSAFALGKL